jgi:SAM-dependent methyltransferase
MSNEYADRDRAASYAALGLAGTYYLAFRDLPDMFARHVHGTRALDFGCGAGRSTRFLQQHGFTTIGIDISEAMLRSARDADPDGTYLQVEDDAATGWPDGPFDLILAAFPFDSIRDRMHRVLLMRAMRERLDRHGRLVLVTSASELYRHEWLSFTTSFEGNERARSGDPVLIAILDGTDRRPVRDYLWEESDYRADLARAGLALLETHRPLGRPGEPFAWSTELTVAPWVIYVCGAG